MMQSIITTEFTPVAALIGGSLIGIASVLLMALNGRIAGVTGIIGGLLPPIKLPDLGWRLAYIAGMVMSPFVFRELTDRVPEFQSATSTSLLIASGLVVGIGVSLASGCTSGHGVCGLARLSPRSATAVAIFMSASIITTLLMRHVAGG